MCGSWPNRTLPEVEPHSLYPACGRATILAVAETVTSFRSTQRKGRIVILRTILLVGAISVMIAVQRGANGAQHVAIPNLMLKPSVNLVLSVGDVEKSKDFYGQVLALKPMSNLNLPGGLIMTRYQVGGTEIKLLHSPGAKTAETGKVDAAIGIRRLTLFFRDPQALAARFKEHGLPAPQFETEPGMRGCALPDKRTPPPLSKRGRQGL